MNESAPTQQDLPLPSEQEAWENMEPLQQQVVELFERFQELNWRFQEKQLTPRHRGEAKDKRAQRRIDQMFLNQKYLHRTDEQKRRRKPIETPGVDDYLGNRAIRNRLEFFILVMETKIEQRENRGTFTDRPAPHETGWRKSPRHALKTFQEILTDPTERIIFTREDLSQPNGMRDAVEAITVDPERLSNTLLENLGLDQFVCQPGIGKRYTSKERLEKKVRAIPHVRRILADLEFIRRPDQEEHPVGQLNFFRMMRIGEGPDADNPNPNAGYILGTQNNGEKIFFKTDLYGAQRRLINIEQNYDEEQTKLNFILETMSSIERNRDEWAGPDNEEKIQEVRTALIQIIASLEHVRRPEKRKLRDNVHSYLNMVSQNNVPAAGWSLKRAKANVGKRLRNMQSISGKLRSDRMGVKNLIDQEEMPYAGFLSSVEGLKEELHTVNGNLSQVTGKLIKLQAHIDEHMHFEPYRTLGLKCSALIDETLHQLMQGTEQGDAAAETAFLKVYTLTKIERTHFKLQAVNRRLLEHGDEVDAKKLLAHVTGIYKQLREHELAPGDTMNEFRDAYIQMYQLIQSIRFTLGDMLEITQDDIEPYRPQQEGQLPLEGTSEQTPQQKPRSRFGIRERLVSIIGSQTPRIQKFLAKVRNHVRGEKPAPQTELKLVKEVSDEEKAAAFDEVRDTLREFDFVEYLDEFDVAA
jgi:hypothetical protein